MATIQKTIAATRAGDVSTLPPHEKLPEELLRVRMRLAEFSMVLAKRLEPVLRGPDAPESAQIRVRNEYTSPFFHQSFDRIDDIDIVCEELENLLNHVEM